MAPCDPVFPPSDAAACPRTAPHISISSHQSPRRCQQPKEGAGGQTDRQAPAGYPGFIAKVSSVGSSSSADARSLHSKPSPLQRRGCQERPRLHRGRSSQCRAAPGVGRLLWVVQHRQGGGQGGRRTSLRLRGRGAARCHGAAGHLQELQVFLAMAPAPAPHPGCPTCQGQCHRHLHAEEEQQVGDAKLGPGQEKRDDARA